MLRVAGCQTPEILGDNESALACMEAFAAQADADGVELLLFPECFLQGYLVEERHLHRHALRLDELPYGRLSRIEQTLVFGDRRAGAPDDGAGAGRGSRT